jgi:hypothetical protein
MTHRDDDAITNELAEKGLEALPELLRVLTNFILDNCRAAW